MLSNRYGVPTGGVLSDMIVYLNPGESTAATGVGTKYMEKTFSVAELTIPGKIRTLTLSADLKSNVGIHTVAFYQDDIKMSEDMAVDTTERTFTWTYFISNANKPTTLSIKGTSLGNNYYINDVEIKGGRLLEI